MGETPCHVRTAAGLAALPRGLAACYHWAGTRHQLPPGFGVTTAPSVEGLAYLTQTAANKCLWFHGDRDFFPQLLSLCFAVLMCHQMKFY